MNISQLRNLVLETISEERRRPSKRKQKTIKENRTRQLARILVEAEKELKEQEGEGEGAAASAASFSDIKANIVNFDAGVVYDTVTDASEGDLNQLQAHIRSKDKNNMPADRPAFGAYAKENLPSKEEFVKRYNEIVAKVKSDGGRGFHKAYMPALEKGDAAQVSNALDDSSGPMGIDVDKSFPKFSAVLEKAKNVQIDGKGLLDMNVEEMFAKKDQIKASLKESSIRSVPLLQYAPHDSFPFPGAEKVIPNAEIRDPETKQPAMKPSEITGPAALFLTLGHMDDSPDKIELPTEPSSDITAGSAKPTQTNVQLVKSLRFALNNMYGSWDSQGMGGAYATSDGAILDGHHRGSSQYLRNGPSTPLPGLYKFKQGFSADFLKMLTAVGNAMGRATKASAPEEKKEAAWHNGTVISEDVQINRWNKLAGLLKD